MQSSATATVSILIIIYSKYLSIIKCHKKIFFTHTMKCVSMTFFLRFDIRFQKDFMTKSRQLSSVSIKKSHSMSSMLNKKKYCAISQWKYKYKLQVNIMTELMQLRIIPNDMIRYMRISLA